jgi:hypothetical protein
MQINYLRAILDSEALDGSSVDFVFGNNYFTFVIKTFQNLK